MSIRAAFGIGTAVGFGVSTLLGAPLAAALVYGLITGTVTAAIAATPPARHGIAVIHARRPAVFTSAWWGGPWLPRTRVLPRGHFTHTVSPAAPTSSWFGGVSGFGRSWFPSSSVGGNTTVYRTPGRATATSFAATGAGGTTHSAARAVPGHATNVHRTTVRFK